MSSFFEDAVWNCLDALKIGDREAAERIVTETITEYNRYLRYLHGLLLRGEGEALKSIVDEFNEIVAKRAAAPADDFQYLHSTAIGRLHDLANKLDAKAIRLRGGRWATGDPLQSRGGKR